MSLIHPRSVHPYVTGVNKGSQQKCSLKDDGYKNTTTSIGIQDFAVSLYSRQFMRLVTTGVRLRCYLAQAYAALHHFTTNPVPME